MFKFLNNNLIAMFLSVSILVLASAYFIEHVLGYEACNLCLIGRFPYFFVIAFSLVFFCFKKFKKILLILIFISFLVLLSAYFIEYVLGYEACNLCLIGITESALTRNSPGYP